MSGKSEPLRLYSGEVKAIHRCPAPVEPAYSRPDLRTPPGGPAAACTALRVILVTLLAWAALLCAGIGGTFDVVSQALAVKLAASVQHLQRHGGTSLSSRADRRELPAIAAELKVAEASAAVVVDHDDGAVSAGAIALPAGQPRSQADALAAIEPSLSARHCLPPSRAPPRLA